MHVSKMQLFFKLGLLHFQCVFYHLLDVQKIWPLWPQCHFQFLESQNGPWGPFEDQEEGPFRIGGCCLCLWCCLCLCGVPWSGRLTCFMTCLCAVSLSGTMRSAMSVLLEKTVRAIFLMLMPWAAIFLMAKSSSAERTILVVKMLTNTWDLRQMRLWCMDLVSCVSV